MKIFDLSKAQVENFIPGKYEMKFTVTQLFQIGIEVTLYYVIRNGVIYYYDEKQVNHNK